MIWSKFLKFFVCEDIERVFVATKVGVANVDLYNIRDKDDFADLILNHGVELRALCHLLIEEDFPYFKLEDGLVPIKNIDELEELLMPYQSKLELAIRCNPEDFQKWIFVDAYLKEFDNELDITIKRMEKIEQIFCERNGGEYKPGGEVRIELEDFTIIKGKFFMGGALTEICCLEKDNDFFMPVDADGDILTDEIESKTDVQNVFWCRVQEDKPNEYFVFGIGGVMKNIGGWDDARVTMARICEHTPYDDTVLYVDGDDHNLVYCFRRHPDKLYLAEYSLPSAEISDAIYELKNLTYGPY